MGTTEQQRLASEFQEWADAETDEERRRVQSRWAGQHEQKTPVLTIPAASIGPQEQGNRNAAAILNRLLDDAGTAGIRPSDALTELRRLGYEYKHTGERVRRLVKAAQGQSTGRGRGSRWRLDN